jgi:putative endonuclease
MDQEKERSRKEVGRIGEQVASKFLERKGFKIIDRNFRKPWGEIDLVALKDGVVRFVEVKAVSRDTLPDVTPSADQRARREMDYRPEEMVQPSKLRKLARTASLYMEQKGDTREFQIDVVGVILNRNTKVARCRFFEQALEDNL